MHATDAAGKHHCWNLHGGTDGGAVPSQSGSAVPFDLQLRLQLVAERKLHRRLRLYWCLFVTVQVEGWDDGLT